MASILVVDDDTFMRDTLMLLLNRKNHHVMGAANGKIAENLCHQFEFDLVITDILMPFQEGIETIMMLKYLFPAIKIIAMSGGGKTKPEFYFDIAKNLGAHFTMEKPFKHDELLYAINKTLKS